MGLNEDLGRIEKKIRKLLPEGYILSDVAYHPNDLEGLGRSGFRVTVKHGVKIYSVRFGHDMPSNKWLKKAARIISEAI